MKTPEFVPKGLAREIEIDHDAIERIARHQRFLIGRVVALCRLFIAETHDPSIVLSKIRELDPEAADALDALKRA